MIKITNKDNKIQILAKMAANICCYAMENPLHVFFEDGNFHTRYLTREKEQNERVKFENGIKMYNYINHFIDNWDTLSDDDKVSAFNLFEKKWDYLNNKISNRIRKVTNTPKESSLLLRHKLNYDGSISWMSYAETPGTESKFDYDELPDIPKDSIIKCYEVDKYIVYIGGSKYGEYKEEAVALDIYRKLENRFNSTGYGPLIKLTKVCNAIIK